MKLPVHAQQPEPDAGNADLTPAVALLIEGAEPFDLKTSARTVAMAELRRLLGAWRRHEPGARLGEDPEELHQLRRTALVGLRARTSAVGSWRLKRPSTASIRRAVTRS